MLKVGIRIYERIILFFFHIAGLSLDGQVSIYVILSCICIFLLSLNIAQYLWYQRCEILKKTSTKPLPRIDEVYYTVYKLINSFVVQLFCMMKSQCTFRLWLGKTIH